MARQLCRNTKTTANTSTIASTKVWMTSLMDALTLMVVSWGTEYTTPAGNCRDNSASRSRTAFATLTALAPGVWVIWTSAADLPLSLTFTS